MADFRSRFTALQKTLVRVCPVRTNFCRMRPSPWPTRSKSVLASVHVCIRGWVCVWGGGCSGLTSENYGRIQSHPVTHTHTQPLGVCGGLGDSEFGRSFQNLGRKSPLVLALQAFGAGCVCEGLDVWLFGGDWVWALPLGVF